MGGKEGAIGRCFIKFANRIHQHVDGKPFRCAVACFAGFSYGDITGGVVKDWSTKEKLELERKDIERQMQEYEAKARKVSLARDIIPPAISNCSIHCPCVRDSPRRCPSSGHWYLEESEIG